MDHRKTDPNTPLLASVSVAQLGVGLLGLVVALKRRHAYDFLFLHGRDDRVAASTRCSWAPRCPRRPPCSSPRPSRLLVCCVARRGHDDVVLGALGAAMVAGYLGEALVRHRLQRSDSTLSSRRSR